MRQPLRLIWRLKKWWLLQETNARRESNVEPRRGRPSFAQRALTLTLALPGDTVLYLLLPLQAAAFAVTLPEAGFLLAANRIVRVFGYR